MAFEQVTGYNVYVLGSHLMLSPVDLGTSSDLPRAWCKLLPVTGVGADTSKTAASG